MIYQISAKHFFRIIKEAHHTIPTYMLRSIRDYWVYEDVFGYKLMGFRSQEEAQHYSENINL